jgi:uncharacterized membrane protein
MKKIINTLILLFLILFSTAYADVIDPDDEPVSFIEDYETYNLYAEVIKAGEKETMNDGYAEYVVQNVRVKILDKRFYGKEYDIVYYLEDGMNTRLPLYDMLKVGDKVYCYALYENDVLDVTAISYYDKTIWIAIICVLFMLAVILIGGKNGVKAIVGLLITMVFIFGLLVPGILGGMNIILLTILVCSLVICSTFLIISGINRKTLIAIVGTVGGICLAGIIGAVFGHLMRLTGINEHARMISTAISEEREMISFKNIMLSAIMISAMGACMDVAMSISSALNELKEKRPDMNRAELIKSGMNIGKDVMGTMTNTLILAYVGSAMLCILLYNVNGFDLTFVLNAEDISDEVLKSLAGSMGLVATIPITALLGGTILSLKKSKKASTKKEEPEIPVNYFKG